MKGFDPNNPKHLNAFYHSPQWKRLRLEVLEEQHYECQICKAKGKLTLLSKTKASVHHVNEIKDRPELRLSKYYTDAAGNIKRNLIALCNDCHNDEHKRFQKQAQKPQFNEEKW